MSGARLVDYSLLILDWSFFIHLSASIIIVKQLNILRRKKLKYFQRSLQMYKIK